MADEPTIKFPEDFEMKESPEYNDLVPIYDTTTGKSKKTSLEKIMAQTQASIIGTATPSSSPTGEETNGQSYRVSNTTGAILVFPNFLDSGSVPVQMAADERSGYITKNPDGWAYVDNTAQADTTGLVPKTDIVDNVTTASPDKPLSANQGLILDRLFRTGAINNKLQAGNDIITYSGDGTDTVTTNRYTQAATDQGLSLSTTGAVTDYAYIKLGIDIITVKRLNLNISSIASSGAGFGFGWNFVTPNGVYYRSSTGVLQKAIKGSLSTTLGSLSTYTAGESIYFDFKTENGIVSFRAGKGDSVTSWFSLGAITGELLFFSRGYGNVILSVDEIVQSAANDYTDQKIEGVNGDVNALQSSINDTNNQLAEIQAVTDPLVYGGPVNKLTEPDNYEKSALSSIFAETDPKQILVADDLNGLKVQVSGTHSADLNFLKLDAEWKDRIKLLATITSITNTPCFGLGYGTPAATPDGHYKGLLYRSSGRLFGMTQDGETNAMSGFVATTDSANAAFVLGDSIELLFDSVARQVTLTKNGEEIISLPYAADIYPSGPIYLNFRDSMTISDVKIVEVAKGGKLETVYISPTGSDDNNGLEATPVATIAKAKELLSESGQLIFLDGDYFDLVVDLAEIRTIKPKIGSRVRWIYGNRFTSATQTSGKTRVYQTPFATVIPTGGQAPYFLWQHDIKDAATEILAGERHPYQNGRTHRLPSTRLYPATSIDEIESTTDVLMYYQDSGILYFSKVEGSDLSVNPIVYPDNSALTATIQREISFTGIDILYKRVVTAGLSGLMQQFSIGMINGAGCLNCGNTVGLIIDYAELFGSNNDGYNGHPNAPDNIFNRVGNVIVRNTVGHDDGDDDFSDHEYSNTRFENCYGEYSGNGFTPASGSHNALFNCMSRKHGDHPWTYDKAGTGFSAQGKPIDGGADTGFLGMGCISIDDNYGFIAKDDETNSANGMAINCVVIRAAIADYTNVQKINCVTIEE